MKQLKDDQVHSETWLDTPFGVLDHQQKAAQCPDDLLNAPGVHLKSKESRSRNGMPRFFGKLTSYTDEEVVVISKIGSEGHKCVWKGTPSEYRAMWRVD